MSELPEALRLADALEQGTYLLSCERDATAACLRRLQAECDALRADAERYRWLRGTYCPSAEALDELADAARAALKEAQR